MWTRSACAGLLSGEKQYADHMYGKTTWKGNISFHKNHGTFISNFTPLGWKQAIMVSHDPSENKIYVSSIIIPSKGLIIRSDQQISNSGFLINSLKYFSVNCTQLTYGGIFRSGEEDMLCCHTP